MRILQLIQKPQRRGAEIFTVQLSEELIVSGHEVRLVALFQYSQEIEFSGPFFKLNRPLSKRFFDVQGWFQLSQLIKEFQPDLVQANAADTLKSAVFSRLFFGWKTKLVYRNANQMGDFIRGFWHRKFNQFLLDRVEGVISVSEASRSDFLNTFDFVKGKSQTIPIGILPQEIKNKLKGKTSLLPNPYLVQVGSWVPEKDPLGMLEIFNAISDPSLFLVFMGAGPLEDKMKQKILELGLSHRVILLPNQSNIFPVLSHAQALVMPSKIEGLPGVILEAMYCKVPVIAYGVGGIPEILKNGKTGWCMTPSDSNAFINSIHEVLTMEAFAKQEILNQAHHLVLSHYTLPQVTRQFEDFYKDLLAQH